MFGLLSQKFSSVFSNLFSKKTLSDADIQQCLSKVQDALLEADVPYEVVQAFSADIREAIVGQRLANSMKPAEQLMKLVYDRLVLFLGGESQSTQFVFPLPSVCLVMGLQGSGKTTTVAKLAYYLRSQAEKEGKRRSVLVASVDFYRPAAIDQLRILAQEHTIDFYQAQAQQPVPAAQEIVAYGKQHGYEIIILDTAGRLHIDDVLMAEIQAIDRTIRPTQKFLVVDSMIGQQSLAVATAFDAQVGFTGGILTKVDSDTKGGVAFAFRWSMRKPIMFMGVGEHIDGLEPFRPERIAERMLDLGDIRSLVERAETKIKQSEQERVTQSLKNGNFTLQEFADQMHLLGSLGSLQQVMKYLPGMGKLQVPDHVIEQGERDMKKWKAVIGSMTKKERIAPRILDGSRKKRIAKGAGVMVADINTLLERFEQSQQFAKMYKKMRFF